MEGICVNFLDQVQFFRFLKGRCHGNQFCGKNGAKLTTPLHLLLCHSETDWDNASSFGGEHSIIEIALHVYVVVHRISSNISGRMYWTDFRNLFTIWKRFSCRWWICTLFSNLSRVVAMATKYSYHNEGKLMLRAFFAHSPDGSKVSFRYYLLGSDTAVPSGLLARLCHAFSSVSFYSPFTFCCSSLWVKFVYYTTIVSSKHWATSLQESVTKTHRTCWYVITLLCIIFVVFVPHIGQCFGSLHTAHVTTTLVQSFWLQNQKASSSLPTAPSRLSCLVLLVVWSRNSAAVRQGRETSLDGRVVHRDMNVFLQQSPAENCRSVFMRNAVTEENWKVRVKVK